MMRRGRPTRPQGSGEHPMLEEHLERLGLAEALFSQAITCVVLLDREYRVVRVNQAFGTQFGLSIEGLPGRRFTELLSGGVMLQHLEEVARTRAPLAVSTPDCRTRGSTGSEPRQCNWALAPLLDDAGDLAFILLMGVDVTAQKRAEKELRTRETVYQSVFNCMSEGVVFQSADGSIVAANPAAERLLGLSTYGMMGRDSNSPEWQAVKEDGNPFPGDQHPAMFTLRTGEPKTNVVMGVRRPDGLRIWLSINSQPVRNPGEVAPHAVVTTFHDISERKVAEERQKQMLHELNHRVRNTLTVVQSIAAQTFRTSPTPAAFTEAFNARLLALSYSHEVLTRNDWTGAQLRELLAGQLRPYQMGGGERFRLTGPDVRLVPKAAIALSLVLSELATNAAKYGSLSVDRGTVGVTWNLEMGADVPRLRIVWREQGGPAVLPPTRRGLGTGLIERSLSHELGGLARIAFNPQGLICEMEFPLEGDGA